MAPPAVTTIDNAPAGRLERRRTISCADERCADVIALPRPLTRVLDRATVSPTLECARAVEAVPDVRSLIERMRNTASAADPDF
ncbi:hypothetical protein [Streptomyces tendae]|uniref:hypothetical protein n=1 Tax=Streptomyces tendae TaxID=1932 RepID=UPI003EBE95C0